MKYLPLILLLIPLSCQIPTGVESDDDGDTTEPVTKPAGMPQIEPMISG